MKDWTYGIVCGWLLAIAVNSLPFADAAIYRKTLGECEKSLPRDKHCIVIGVEAK